MVDRGRKLVLHVEVDGQVDTAVWNGDDEDEDEDGDLERAGQTDVERILRDRRRAAFAEELFAHVSWMDLMWICRRG